MITKVISINVASQNIDLYGLILVFLEKALNDVCIQANQLLLLKIKHFIVNQVTAVSPESSLGCIKFNSRGAF